MKKISLALTALGVLGAAGCAFDAHDEAPPPKEPAAKVALADTTSAAGPALDSADAFPYRLVDRFVSFEDFSAMLLDATAALPGVLRSADAVNAANELLAKVSASTPDFRLHLDPQSKKGGVRVVQVYADAPVYIIGGFALLPDTAGNAVNPAAFALDGSPDPALDAFCSQEGARCIPLSREHVENRNAAAIVLAARTIIVRGVNHTDGMSVVTMSETFLVPHLADKLDLSPRGAQYLSSDGVSVWPTTPEYPGRAPSPSGYGSTKVVAYRAMPRSPQVIDTLDSPFTQDIRWQQESAAAKAGVPLSRASQGLAGLAGGSLLVMTMRSSHVQARSIGQTGGWGAFGSSGAYDCGYGKTSIPVDWKIYDECLDMTFSAGPDCVRLCGGFTPPGAGGAGGSGGDTGTIHIMSAVDTSPWCAFSEATLRELHPKPGLRGDAAEGYDVRCADGVGDDRDGSNVDCASSFCNTDLNVTVCGSREAALIDLGGTPVRNPHPRPPFNGVATKRAPDHDDPPITTTDSFPPRGGGGGGGGGWWPPIPIDGDILCADARPGDSIDLNGGAGEVGAFGGGVPTSVCTDPDPGASRPMLCGSATRGAVGAKGPDGATTPPLWYMHTRASWTRLAWAIAMHRMHPLEIQRRLAVAHARFRSGQTDSARARYLSTRFLLDANQRRSAPPHVDGKIFDCQSTVSLPASPSGGTAKTGAPAPTGLTELCGLRVELDTYLARVSTGKNFFGYAPDYVVPRVVPTTAIIDWATTELVAAKASLATWQLATAVDDVAKTLAAVSDASLGDQITELHAQYAPGGSLFVALENARKQKATSIAEMKTLDAMAKADTAYRLILVKDDKTEESFGFDKLEMKVIGFGIKAAVSAAGAPEAAGPISDAITGAIGEDSIGWDGSADVRLNTLAGEIVGGLPAGGSAALDAESLPEGSRDLQKLKLDGELFQIILRMRDETRNYARAVQEEQRVLAQIAEAQASEQRLVAHKSDYARHDASLIDAALNANYVSALRGVRRAGEYVFLAERAAERDGVPFAVAADGTRTNKLMPTLDALLSTCGTGSAANVDVRLDPASIDCYRTNMVAPLASSVLYGYTSTYSKHGAITKVVPITPSMRYVDKATGTTRYRVSVDVDLGDAHAVSLLGDAAAHKLTDMTVLLDTGVAATDASYLVGFSRTDKDAFWLGPTTLGGGTGKDPNEFVVLGGAAGGPLGSEYAAPLQVLFLTPGWTADPSLTFSMCRGSAAANAALVSSTSGPPSACRLTSYPPPSGGVLSPTAAGAYVGRSLLGRYSFTVPAEALVGTTNALRVYFQFDARAAL